MLMKINFNISPLCGDVLQFHPHTEAYFTLDGNTHDIVFYIVYKAFLRETTSSFSNKNI